MTRCTAYEDLFGEVLAFMSQKLRRDSVRMPQAQLETLLAFSLPKQDGSANAVSAGTGQSEEGVSRGKEQQKAEVSLQTERKMDDSVETGQSEATANKSRHKISNTQVFM